MEFYIPTETGEFLAFCAAAVTVLFGLFALFAPGTALKLAGLQMRDGSREGYAFARSAGGFYAGIAIVALLMAQSWIYMAIGGGFALAAFGRILSLMSDGSLQPEPPRSRGAGGTRRAAARICLRLLLSAKSGFLRSKVREHSPRSQLLPRLWPTYGAFLRPACCESRFPMLDEPRNSEKAGAKACRN
jgi:hypothetical protein